MLVLKKDTVPCPFGSGRHLPGHGDSRCPGSFDVNCVAVLGGEGAGHVDGEVAPAVGVLRVAFDPYAPLVRRNVLQVDVDSAGEPAGHHLNRDGSRFVGRGTFIAVIVGPRDNKIARHRDVRGRGGSDLVWIVSDENAMAPGSADVAGRYLDIPLGPLPHKDRVGLRGAGLRGNIAQSKRDVGCRIDFVALEVYSIVLVCGAHRCDGAGGNDRKIAAALVLKPHAHPSAGDGSNRDVDRSGGGVAVEATVVSAACITDIQAVSASRAGTKLSGGGDRRRPGSLVLRAHRVPPSVEHPDGSEIERDRSAGTVFVFGMDQRIPGAVDTPDDVSDRRDGYVPGALVMGSDHLSGEGEFPASGQLGEHDAAHAGLCQIEHAIEVVRTG